MNKTITTPAREVLNAAKTLIRALTTYPDAITFKEVQSGRVVALEIVAHPKDQPVLIGKHGLHIDAINEVLKEMARRNDLNLVALLREPVAGKESVQRKKKAELTNKEVEKLLNAVIAPLFYNKDFALEIEESTGVTIFQLFPDDSDEALPRQTEDSLGLLIHAIGRAAGRIIQISCPSR